jgi:hypothetical protein
LTLADLRRFLECPLQASARVLLPLGDDDDAADDAEAALREHERLDESRLRTIPFLREVLLGAPAEQPLADAYDRAAALAVLDGTLPSGLFGLALRERHLVLLTCWRDGLSQATDGATSPPSILWLGAAPEHRTDLAPLPALDLPLPGGATIAVGGRTEPCGETASGGRMVVSLLASTGRDSVERDLLRPFFTHLALSAMDAGEGPTRAILVRPNDDGSPHLDERLFPAMTAGQARGYLGALAAELLSQVHATFLPCEAIFSWRKRREKGDPIGIRDMVLLLRDDNWTRFLSDRGPIPDPRAYPVPSEDIAAALVERRFGPYFGALATALPETDDTPAPPKGKRR